VKTTSWWYLFGPAIAGVIYGHAPLRAEPAGARAAHDHGTLQAGGPPVRPGGPPIATGGAPLAAGGAPLVTGGPGRPWNRGVSADSRRAARTLFLEGNRLFRIPLFAKAAELYVLALARWKHPAIYFNLALAQLNLGEEVAAHDSLQLALAHGAEPLGAEQFQEAQKQLREVKRRIGQIRVTCKTRGAEVSLDGVTLFIGPGTYQGWVKAKPHELTAKKAGYLSEARRVTVSAGQLQDVELELVTLIEATDASRRWAAWKPWATVAAGGAIVAGGGVLHVLAFRNFNAFDAEFQTLPCATEPRAAPRGCAEGDIRPTLSARLRRAERQQVIAVGSYVAGGSLIAAGVVLSYLNRPRLTEQRSSHSILDRVAVAPAVSGDMLGIGLRLSH
jgi:hypothetical protein